MDVLSPLVFKLSAAYHVYVAAILLDNGIITLPPLQIVISLILSKLGPGFIVTVTVCGEPVQPRGVEVGVMV